MAVTISSYTMKADEINYRLPEFDPFNPIKLDENTYFLPAGVIGNELANRITGNSIGNLLVGGGGKDTLEGGQGHDMYIVSDEGTVIIEAGNGGQDMVNANVSYVLSENVENLALTGNANINGTGNALDNLLMGNEGRNHLTGGGGNDNLNGGAGGFDTLDGGKGNDIYFVSDASDVVIEGANGGTDTVWINTLNFDVSTLKNVEVIKYSKDIKFDDLSGFSAPTEDTFIFNTKVSVKTKAKKIDDFDVATDTVALSKAVFSKIAKTGELSKAAFWTGSKAHDKSDRVIYNKKTGALSYDADGSGAGKAIKFAQLDKNLKMTADDFLVI
jgi:serralysin